MGGGWEEGGGGGGGSEGRGVLGERVGEVRRREEEGGGRGFVGGGSGCGRGEGEGTVLHAWSVLFGMGWRSAKPLGEEEESHSESVLIKRRGGRASAFLRAENEEGISYGVSLPQ